MMAQVTGPLRHLPRAQKRQLWLCCSRQTFLRLALPSFFTIKTNSQQLSFATLPSSYRNIDFRSHGLKLPEDSVALDARENNSDSDYPEKKSRNEKKREARRAVRWGMDLATFSNPQIKQILRVASLEREVFDALMLVKRLGPDVREGKRRQFNYIGRLLRNVQPELMEALIQASKDGDQIKFQALAGTETWLIEEDDEEEEETEYEENEEELRKLVRRVHSLQEHQLIEEKEGEANPALAVANKKLLRFLSAIAKQMPVE
ncbi:PREDICTED: uncharacterized protein LOC104605543 isoform X2 [Nelumbo nucifera]|uniref:Uncharacterized protein LOC104605543 isoform X2 n=1 Tax=Nelumbo nucifera TaxID=4432 RepID=A0A1U8Q9C4_NELNU|nr:PREDICTED: uncharacterized protein LOC104605543 isoform X2 [Nelumbo nucifera]